MSHSMKLAREFWANKVPEARMRVAFSKTRGKARGGIVINTGGELAKVRGCSSHRAFQPGVRVWSLS